MGPSVSVVAFKMVKAGIKNVRIIPHLITIILSVFRNYIRLRRWRRESGTTVAIALIEHMGDIVAAEPLSRLAKKTYPEASIAWVSRAPYVDIARNFRSVDKVVVVTCLTEWLLLWGSQMTDVTWDLHLSERVCPRCGIFFRKPGSPGMIIDKTYLNYGNLLTVNCLNAALPPIDEAPQIVPDDTARQAVDRLDLPQTIVVIHCKANELSRDWDTGKWLHVMDWLINHTTVTVCEIGSKPVVVQQDSPRTRNLCGTLSIMQTAEVIRRAVLFIGIDSGPAHLANAIGTPGIVLLGRYRNFATYNPYSGGYADGALADLVRSEGPAANIEVEQVVAKVSKRLGIVQHDATDRTVPAAPGLDRS